MFVIVDCISYFWHRPGQVININTLPGGGRVEQSGPDHLFPRYQIMLSTLDLLLPPVQHLGLLILSSLLLSIRDEAGGSVACPSVRSPANVTSF